MTIVNRPEWLKLTRKYYLINDSICYLLLIFILYLFHSQAAENLIFFAP